MDALSNPILNSPYEAPERHFDLGPNGPTGEVLPGRRPSESFIPIPVSKKKRGKNGASAQQSLDLFDVTGERREQNSLINDMRQRVELWRARGYPHVTSISHKLMQYWADPTREERVLFCQREATETAIYLADPAPAAKTALRSVGRRINQLGAEADELERQLDQLVAAGNNIDRLGSEASFAHLCATAPVPTSSGRTSRHRLNYPGNRAANRALHMIVLVRLRYCEQTRSYMDRRLAEHKTKKEVIRCLKRFAAHELYRTLRADLATLTTRT